jgi:hypothetical protein
LLDVFGTSRVLQEEASGVYSAQSRVGIRRKSDSFGLPNPALEFLNMPAIQIQRGLL